MRTNLVCLVFVFLNVFLNEFVSAQKEANNWYFSENAGINFSTIPPSSINLSQLNTADNSSAISDANGQILFYTDGITVYNKLNQVMPNGFNLAGNQSGGQATLIIPIPKSNKFIVFSVPDVGNKSLYYSIVNMGLNNQKGDVELKNQKLFDKSTEKIAGIYNCSNDYYWVITHQYETDLFYVYKIDKNGLNRVPVISSVGLVHIGGPSNDVNNSAGQLSISKDGKHIASALYYSGEIELFDFDVSTGKISNPKLIPNYSRAWGVEFSGDGSKLYISQWTQTNITQFDLNSNNINTIISSAITIGNCSGSGGYYSGYLQRGPNDKIYIAQWDSDFLSYIDKPNELGSLCNFRLNGYSLIIGKSKAGLCRVVIPELVSSALKILGSDTLICEGSSIVLKSFSDSTHWNTGSIGNQIVVSKAGVYWAEVNSKCYSIRDSILISYQSEPTLDLGSDRQICPNDVDTIWSNDVNTVWQDGSVGSYFIINKSGIVSGTLKSNCGDVVDSIVVSYYSSIPFSLPKDTLLCDGETLQLSSPFDSTTWIDGTIGKSLIINKPGIYWAEVNSKCYSIRDSILISYQPKPTLELGSDRQICPNEMDTIWSNDVTTVWQDGSIGPYFIIKKAGKVIATKSNICGSVSDSILVSYFVNSNVDLGPDTTICEGILLTLNSGSINTIWFDNTTGSTKQILKAGTYWASIVSSCGTITDSIRITEMKVFGNPYLPNDTFVCEGINLNLSIPIIDELWNNQFLNLININGPGKYWYSFKDICNNLGDTIEVFYDSIPQAFPSDNLVFCGSEVYRFSTGNSKTVWSDGTVGSEIRISKSGIYHYLVSNCCGNFSDSIQLEFIEDANFYLPNVFSPNGDQVNDVFPGPQFTADFEIEIYDRWGSQVFKSTNIHWTGSFKNQNVSPGVYSYIIRSKACSNQLKYGNVTVVR
ncbi:MAG: gliding motility-associated C-terminal domain-containing protein [Saprospiraceae bacterium]